MLVGEEKGPTFSEEWRKMLLLKFQIDRCEGVSRAGGATGRRFLERHTQTNAFLFFSFWNPYHIPKFV